MLGPWAQVLATIATAAALKTARRKHKGQREPQDTAMDIVASMNDNWFGGGAQQRDVDTTPAPGTAAADTTPALLLPAPETQTAPEATATADNTTTVAAAAEHAAAAHADDHTPVDATAIDSDEEEQRGAVVDAQDDDALFFAMDDVAAVAAQTAPAISQPEGADMTPTTADTPTPLLPALDDPAPAPAATQPVISAAVGEQGEEAANAADAIIDVLLDDLLEELEQEDAAANTTAAAEGLAMATAQPEEAAAVVQGAPLQHQLAPAAGAAAAAGPDAAAVFSLPPLRHLSALGLARLYGTSSSSLAPGAPLLEAAAPGGVLTPDALTARAGLTRELLACGAAAMGSASIGAGAFSPSMGPSSGGIFMKISSSSSNSSSSSSSDHFMPFQFWTCFSGLTGSDRICSGGCGGSGSSLAGRDTDKGLKGLGSAAATADCIIAAAGVSRRMPGAAAAGADSPTPGLRATSGRGGRGLSSRRASLSSSDGSSEPPSTTTTPRASSAGGASSVSSEGDAGSDAGSDDGGAVTPPLRTQSLPAGVGAGSGNTGGVPAAGTAAGSPSAAALAFRQRIAAFNAPGVCLPSFLRRAGSGPAAMAPENAAGCRITRGNAAGA